jgi:5-(carboxyamino)imidazole ribonucleotide mutase
MAKTNKDELNKGGEPVVGILTGSPSDLDVVRKAEETLHSLGIPCELFVLSAHRTPDLTARYVKEAESRGIEVIIAGAGMAAHLAGAVAANTFLPVIGVPLKSSLDGLDALLSTVQMPPGIPVATVGIDGSKNAAYLAARILARKFPEITERLQADLEKQQSRYDNPFAARDKK